LPPCQGIFEKPGKNSLSLKQLAGLFKNALAWLTHPTGLAKTLIKAGDWLKLPID
jgi:hypothetical protein